MLSIQILRHWRDPVNFSDNSIVSSSIVNQQVKNKGLLGQNDSTLKSFELVFIFPR